MLDRTQDDVLAHVFGGPSEPPPVRSALNFLLTPAQCVANKLMGGPATHLCMVGGSRSGKTSLITRRIIKRALQSTAPSRHLIARFRANAVRAAVLADTFPKVMRLAFPGVAWHKRQEGCVEFDNGSQVWFGGLDDAERIEKILGMEFATIFASECSQIPYSSILVLRTRLAQPGTGLRLKAFYDLNPTTKAHWTHVEFGEKRDPITRLLLENPEDFDRMFINPMDNQANLDPAYLKSIASMPKAYRERFFEGKYVDAIEGALWTIDGLELCREDPVAPFDTRGDKMAQFTRVCVAVDPSGAKSKLDVKSDEIGITVMGLRKNKTGVVLADATCKGNPSEWGRAAVAAFKKWRADVMVAEANYGGGMVQGTIQAVDSNVPVKLVQATRGKVVRAEPVAALFDEGKITLAGRFNELEGQLCNFSREGYLGDRSPDRADSMIWAATELMLGDQSRYTLANVR